MMQLTTIMLVLVQTQNEKNKQQQLTTVTPSDVSKSINDGIQHDLPWELLVAGLGATLVTVAVISARRWWLGRHEDPSPMVLFSAISRRAGLGWRDRYLLWRISKTYSLPTPISLMLSKGTLRHYSDLYLNSHSANARRRTGQRLSHIESALFD